jgi:hypothetical protein
VSLSNLDCYTEGRSSSLVRYGIGIAEIVGSNPTRSTNTNLGNYGIILSSFFSECRINSAASRFSCLVERGDLAVKLRLPRVIEAQL